MSLVTLFGRRRATQAEINAVGATCAKTAIRLRAGRFIDLEASREISRAAAGAINFKTAVPEHIHAAALRHHGANPILIDMTDAERGRITALVERAGVDPEHVVPFIDAYDDCNGILLPRKALITLQGDRIMSKFERDAPLAYRHLKALCDDPHCHVTEAIVYGFKKPAADAKKDAGHLWLIYDIPGAKRSRPQSLTDAEINEFVGSYAKLITKHHYGNGEPHILPLGDVTLASLPLSGQDEHDAVVLFLVFVSAGSHSEVVKLTMFEHIDKVTREILDAMGRSKSKSVHVEETNPAQRAVANLN